MCFLFLQMSYASDKLSRGYLRKNMPRIVETVNPREIVVHLPCLTDYDRETIEAKRETCGPRVAMARLLDCLKRREDWPEQFIAALEACEHRIIAAELRAEYDALRGTKSAPHLPVPGPVTQPIQETEKPAPPSSPPAAAAAAAPVVKLTTPPEQPQPQTEAVVVPPATPSSSPDSVRGSPNAPPPPEQVDFLSHHEPEENLEPEPLTARDLPNEAMNVRQAAEENTETPQAPDLQVEPSEVEDSTLAASMEDQPSPVVNTVNKPIVSETEPVTAVMEDTTNAVAVEASPGRSVFPLTTLDTLILTPEKPPVQKSRSALPVLEMKPDPQNTQVFKIFQRIEIPPRPPAEMANGGVADHGSASEDDAIFFSQPGVLVSVEPPDQNNTTIRPTTPEYSGDSGRLEMSEAVSPCQENGINLNKQVETCCTAPSLDVDNVREYIGQVAGDPSILNQGRPPSPEADEANVQMPLIQVNGEPAQEIAPVPPPSSRSVNDIPTSIDPKQPDSGKMTRGLNSRYILTAAGVGACALLIAWRFKH
ncbi:uncharacterized protein [Eucyclogobius newberryi]|uniref:uncharacterized protein n=1 Tax=Eucyclogobius newberryi TaxID=166745 RepID=UPI003B59C827